MHKLLHLTLIAICAIPLSVSAFQDTPQSNLAVESYRAVSGYEGTFQIIWTTVKDRNYFSTDLEGFISDNRHQTDVKYFQLTEHTYIMILPHDQINDPSFIPLEEVYVFDEDFRIDSEVR